MNYDGGWEQGIEAGDGLSEILLGTVHPYDRSDLYEPAHRWGTRHELASGRFNDPIDELDALGLLTEGAAPRGSPSTPAAPRAPVANLPSRQAPPTLPARRAPIAKPPLPSTATKAERAAWKAEMLGISVPTLRQLRRSFSGAAAATRTLSPKNRDAECARMMGITPASLARFRQVDSMPARQNVKPLARPATTTRTVPDAPVVTPHQPRLKNATARTRTAKPSSTTQVTTRVIPTLHPTRQPLLTLPVCGSCGTQITINGKCRCSG